MSRQSTEAHWHYQVYGQRLCSSLPLRELPRSSFESRDVAFRCLSRGEVLDLTCHDSHLLTRRSTSLGYELSLYRTAADYILRWEGLCDFLVSKDGRHIQCYPSPDTDVLWVQGILYNMVLSFALSLRGVSNFHASAVALPQGAVGFMAEPGTGKSTLAAAFTALGHRFLTDDVLAVREVAGEFQAYPGYPHVSISSRAVDGLFGRRDDLPVVFHNGEKQRIAVADLGVEFSGAPVPLRALHVLRRGNPSSGIRMERQSRVLAVRSLLEHTNCLPLLPQEVLQPHMAFIERMTASVPVYLLQYPSGLEDIHRVVAAVTRSTAALVDHSGQDSRPVLARRAINL